MRFQSFKEILPHWELADSFTAIEAAALIAGYEPSAIDESLEWFKDRESGITDSSGINEFTSMLNVLMGAIRSRKLKSDDPEGHLRVISIERSDLVKWISSKGGKFRPEFFFPSDDTRQHLQPAIDPDTAHRLRQLETDKARLVEQVADLEAELAHATDEVKWSQRRLVEEFDRRDELQRQLQEATAAVQQAPQQATAAPQEAPQIDADKLHPKRQASYEVAIAAMLDRLVTNGKWPSEASLINSIEGTHKVSARTLTTLFAEAKRRMAST